MSYAQHKELSGNRTVAIVIVALLHAALGYAIVTGLAYNVIKKAAEDLKTFDVEEEPPPPEEKPPPPPENTPPPPQIVAPPPIVQTVREAPPPVITPTAPPAPPAPPAPAVVTKAQSVKGNLQGLFSGDDYPADAQRNDEQGSVRVTLSIGTDGRVAGCNVTSSSGSRSLDNATCRILRSRARFTPAKLTNGQPTTDTYSQTITWRLEG